MGDNLGRGELNMEIIATFLIWFSQVIIDTETVSSKHLIFMFVAVILTLSFTFLLLLVLFGILY